MRLPNQSQPVQRTIPGQPHTHQGPDGLRGVEPSNILDDILGGIGTAGKIIQGATPIVESLGSIFGF